MALPLSDQGWVPEDTFGARLALIRQRNGWSAAEAASACGNLGDQNWRNWEDGKHPRDFERVCRKVARETGVDLDWLMRGGPLEPPHQNWKLMMAPDLHVLTGSGSGAATRDRTHPRHLELV